MLPNGQYVLTIKIIFNEHGHRAEEGIGIGLQFRRISSDLRF